MERELRFDELMGGVQGLNGLLDKSFRSLGTSVALADALRRLQPLYEDVAHRHDALLEQYARRDGEGNVIYLDEAKTRIDPLPELEQALNDFFANTIQVSVPKVPADGFGLAESALRLGEVSAVLFLTDVEVFPVLLKRNAILDVLQALDSLMVESFASSEATARIAKARQEIVKAARSMMESRKEIVLNLSAKDEEGHVIFLDDVKQEVAVTKEMEQAVAEFANSEVTLNLPVLKPDDFALAEDGVLSPRRVIGLVPILTMTVDQ